MPLFKIKKVWDFCTYNKAFFILIFILFLIINFISEYAYNNFSSRWIFIIQLFLNIIVTGYGMIITRERINHGVRLPKIDIMEVFVLGFKSCIVFIIFLFIQGIILASFSFMFDFPIFDLEELLFELQQTLELVYTHDSIYLLIFFVFGGILFYVTTFFLEIAVARLADTGSLFRAFNLKSIIVNYQTFIIDD